MRRLWSRADVVGVLLTIASVHVALALMLAVDGGWFFRGDTQAAYYGWWYHVGEELRSGNLPVLDVQAWRAGNLTAEGQWAVFNPVVWLLGLLTTVTSSVVGLATAVKFVVTSFGAVGAFVLSRSYGAHPAAAYVAGLASSLGGMTVWLDLPSWVSGLTIWSLLPWAWWAVRRTTLRGANPLPALAFTYLLVTTGYVYGTLMLLLVLAALGVELLASAGRRRLRPWLGILAFCGLVSITVYLPGVLTMDTTIRSGAIALEGRLTTTPLDVLTSFLPSAGAEGGFEQQTAWRYVGWFAPLLVLVRWRAVRQDWRWLAGPLVAVVLIFVVVNGPAEVGPLRWPMRLQPFLVQFLAVLVAVLVSRHSARLTRRRAAAGVAWVGGSAAWYAWRDDAMAAEHLLSGLLVVVALVVVVWLAARRPWPAALVAGTVSLGVVALQLTWFPEPPSDERNMPETMAGYRTQLTSAEGDVLVVGQQDNRTITNAALSAEVLAGSMWYLNPHAVQNTYTTISFRAYYERYCMRVHGQTCNEILGTLFSPEPTTGRLRVDLLSVSTLLLIKADVGEPPVPDGWHVSDETPYTVTWVRDDPLPTAGGPVWSSDGTLVTVVRQTDRTLELDVRAVPSSGGTVVLSRLAWPGYRTSAGSFADPTDDYLLTLDLPAEAAGETVTVQFDPPAWKLELGSLALAVLGGVVWSVAALRSRRPRPGAPTGAGVSSSGPPAALASAARRS